MFCSNCGKSLWIDDEKCPHCGAAVGESRFDGNPPYTGAQEKLRPGKAVVRSYGKHYSTDFVVNSEKAGKELPSDTDSSYRTAKSLNAEEETRLFNAETEDDDTAESKAPEEKKPSHSPFSFNFLRRSSEETAETEEPVAEPDDSDEVGEDGLTAIERDILRTDDDFQPTKPIGISEDVSSYMQRLRENEARKKAAAKPKKKPAEDDIDEDAFADELNRSGKAARKASARSAKAAKPAEPDVSDDEPAYGDDEVIEEEEKKEKSSPFSRLRIRKSEKKKKPEPEENEDESFGDITTDDEITNDYTSGEADEFGDFDDESKPKKKAGLGFLKGIKLPKTKKPSKEPEPEEDESDAGDEELEEEYGEEEYQLEKQRKDRFRLIKNIAVVVIALAVIIGAVIGVTNVREKSKTAPIETVTLQLWNDGIELIESRVKDSYRKTMLALYDKSNPASYLTLQAAFTADLDSLAELMPESPMQHDQVFVNTLKAIQESINNCLSNDALSMTDGTKTSSEKDADSALRWESVQSIVTALKNATNVGQLEAIIKGDRIELIQNATATPVPTATPAPYSTLAKGASGIAVTNLQTRLTELGFMSSSIDGDYGNKTKTAVEKFQQAAGIEVTGIADVATQELLFSDQAPKAK